jgi:hypothetical protein
MPELLEFPWKTRPVVDFAVTLTATIATEGPPPRRQETLRAGTGGTDLAGRRRPVKLLNPKLRRIVTGSLSMDADGNVTLLVEGERMGALAAAEEGLTLLAAKDEERQALVDSGYALPSEIVSSGDGDDSFR